VYGILLQVETIMAMETVNEIEIENVDESHVIPVETIGITETSETVGILEIIEIMPGMFGIPKTVGTILIPGYLGTTGIQGRTEMLLLGRKNVRKLWNVAVNVSVNVSVRRI
jgi:hypothetical protein